MFRHGKINWRRLAWAAKETLLVELFGILLIALFITPIIIALITNCIWWISTYLLVFFIMDTWEKYNRR